MHNHQSTAPPAPGRWTAGPPPPNVVLGVNTLVTGELAFKRFHSTLDTIQPHGSARMLMSSGRPWPACWLVADWPQGQADSYHVYVAWLKQPPTKGRTLRLS